jgi:hypothetical protein
MALLLGGSMREGELPIVNPFADLPSPCAGLMVR